MGCRPATNSGIMRDGITHGHSGPTRESLGERGRQETAAIAKSATVGNEMLAWNLDTGPLFAGGRV